VAFYLLSGLAATLGQYLMNPLSETPNLGASGAIAGVLSAYLIFCPKAKILGLSVEMGVLYAPAWSYLIWWVGSQIVSVIFEAPHTQGGVAYMAHIGGFACGILAGLIARWLTPMQGVTYDQEVTRSRTHAGPLGVVRFVRQGLQSAVLRMKPRKVQPQEGV
jgi:membrane associated rhomboid family serine protease